MPLANIRVLDLGRVIAAPFCCMLLADLGAEVIRVERSTGAEDRYFGYPSPSGDNFYFVNVNRNKRGISLNFEHNAKAREILMELVRKSDIVVENFSPAAAKALGITYENLKEVKPDIIFAQISGFGSIGPYSQRLCFDPIAKAMSGSMSITGPPGPPNRDPVSYIDFGTGGLTAAAVLAALYHRKETGEGQMVDAALYRTAVTYMSPTISQWETGKIRHQQMGNRTFAIGPADIYRTKDGRWVYISLMTNPIWRRFCRFIGRAELADDPRLPNDLARWEHRDICDKLVKDWVASQTAEEVIAAAEKIPIPCGICYDQTEVAHDPQVEAMEILTEVPCQDGNMTLVINPLFTMSATPPKVERSFPAVGQHNEEIYCGLLGYSSGDLAKLKGEGVI